MPTPNPFTQQLDAVVQAMQDEQAHIARMSQGVQPYNSTATTPEEEQLIYQNPHARYPGVTDPQTQLPISNAQAAQMMLKEMGPEAYIAFVEKNDKRSQAQAAPQMMPGGMVDNSTAPAPVPSAAPSPIMPPPEVMQ